MKVNMMMLLASIAVILAETDPTTLVPVGAVTTMLVAVFTLFMKRASLQDKRIDDSNKSLIVAAEKERDQAFRERDKAIKDKEVAENRYEGILAAKDKTIHTLEIENMRLSLGGRRHDKET